MSQAMPVKILQVRGRDRSNPPESQPLQLRDCLVAASLGKPSSIR